MLRVVHAQNYLFDRGAGQWKRMEEVPHRTSLAPLASPFLYFV